MTTLRCFSLRSLPEKINALNGKTTPPMLRITDEFTETAIKVERKYSAFPVMHEQAIAELKARGITITHTAPISNEEVLLFTDKFEPVLNKTACISG